MNTWRSVRLMMVLVAIRVLAAAAPSSADAAKDYTGHDAYAEELAILRREHGGAYKEFGKHGAWDDAAEKFLDDWAVYHTYVDAPPLYRDVPVPKPADLVRQGRALVVDAHCDDPAVLACYGIALAISDEAAAALPVLQKAVKSLAASKYADSVVWRAAHRSLWLERSSPDGQACAKICAERALKLANIPAATRAERLRAYQNVRSHVNSLKADERVKYMTALRQADGADPWVVDTADGRLHIDIAWEFRGNGYADKVTEKGWKGFFKHLTIARECLTRAWELAPDIPKAADEMVSVANGAGGELGEQPAKWFERAINVQLDCRGAYAAMLNSLRPRWHGSHEAMLELGRRAAATKRYDTDAPWQFVEAVLLIVMDYEHGDSRYDILKDAGIYDEVVAVVDGYDQLAAKKGNRWYRTFRAALAWRAERHEEARKIIDELGDAADLSALRPFSTDPPKVALAKMLLMGGPQADNVRGGENASRDKRNEDAIKFLGDAQAALEKSAATDAAAAAELSRTKPFFDRRLTALRRRVTLQNGEWADVQPDAMLTSWSKYAGVWKVGDDGTLSGRFGQRYVPTLVLASPLSQAFEITGRAGHGEGLGRPAVCLRSKSGGRAYVVFYEQAVILNLPEASLNERFKRDRSEQADFLVRYEHGKLNVRVNDKPVVTDYDLPERLRDGVRPGIAFVGSLKGTATFSKLRARSLEPLEPDDPADADKQGPPADPNAPPEGL
jgi:hypothetical protein